MIFKKEVVKMDIEKVYLQPMGMVLSAVNDLVELQKGRLTLSDTPHGRIHFLVSMYGFKWELQFTVTDIGNNRSSVKIEVDGELRDKERMIHREYALLDSILLVDAKIEVAGKHDIT